MQYIKNTLKSLLLSSFLFSSSAFSLEFLLKVKPYVGVDAQLKHMDFNPGAGQNLFRKNVMQGNGYIGFDINDYFGLETGFESTFQKAKKVSLSIGDQGLGYVILPGQAIEGHTFKNKLSGWHVNFLGFSPWLLENNSLRFFGSVGFSHKRIVLIDETTSTNGIPLSISDIALLRNTYTARKTLLRFSVGAQKMLNKNWGLRAILSWENTRKFRSLHPKEAPQTEISPNTKNSFAMGLGVLYKF